MRASLRWLLRGSCSVLAAIGMSAGTVHAGDIGLTDVIGGDVVGSLSVMGDLEPSAGLPLPERSYSFKPAPVVNVGSQVRSSVPAVDRSEEYLSRDVFANSKAIVPLLVEDLQPPAISVVRPMSGRSVGARPSLPWTKRAQASSSN